MRRPQLRGRRNLWLDRLARLMASEGDAFARLLWNALDEQLLTDGMDGRRASAIALRCCRLAVLLLEGVEQRSAAGALGVSPRTAKRDAERLRRLVEGGWLGRSRPGGLRPVPRTGARVSMPPSRPRQRAE